MKNKCLILGRKELNQSKFIKRFLRKNLLVFLMKKCNQLRIREVINKFVDWCDEINLYFLSYAYNFCRENKTNNILLVVEI